MRLLKKKPFSFLLAIFCLIVSILASSYVISSSTVRLISQFPEQNALELAVSLDKKSYKRNEPIQTTFKIKNIGIDPILVNGRLAFNSPPDPKFMDVYCEITGQNGNPIPFGAYVEVRDLRTSDFVRLNSGDIIQTVIADLHDFYKITDPGEYSIRAIYINTFDPDNGLVAWKGETRSDINRFVIEP